jgi:VanZ family protein
MPKAQAHGIHSTRLHAIMYGMLLVATPFVLLQNFLVEKIAQISSSSFELGNTELPILPILTAVLVIVLLVRLRSYLTWTRVLAPVIVVLMNALSQQITDYYFDHNFYDLQQNWHYFAYGIFAYMVYRDLAPRKVPPAKIMLITYLVALSLSTFDEAFQMHMSSRVFDVSDIAKDLWGSLMGIVFLYLIVTEPGTLARQWKRVRHRRVQDYLKHPPSLLLLMFVFALLLLCYSSLLSEYEYFGYVVLLTVLSFTAFLFLLHLNQYRIFRFALISTFVCVALLQTYFFVKYRSDNIVYNRHGLTVYKGIPILFFDVMVFPDGTFRLVDKKHFFNFRDQNFFKKQRTDIIVISSGSRGEGGHGFPVKAPVQFIYNPYTQRGTQVIILENSQACELFNRLKDEGKNVLFVLHNTC